MPIVLAFSTQSVIANLSSKAMLSVQGSYNDNIFFIDEDRPPRAELDGEAITGVELINPETGRPFPREQELSDYQIVISPEIEIVYGKDRYKALLNGKLDFINYQDLTELNDIDHHLSGELDYEITVYTKLRIEASYSRDSQPDRDLQTSGLIVGTSIRDKQKYGFGIEHELTPLSQIIAGYNYQQEDFVTSDLDDDIAAILQSEIVAEELLQRRQADDSKLHSTSLSYRYDIGDRLPDGIIFTTASYMHLITEGSTQDNVMALLGLSYQVRENFRMSIDGGVRYSHEEFDEVQLQLLAEAPYYHRLDLEQTQDSWGPVAHAELKYQGYLTDAGLKATFDVQPASGNGTFTERAGLKFDIGHQLNEKFRIRGFASYFNNKRDGVKQPPPVATAEALAVHNAIPQLQERLNMESNRLNAVDNVTVNLGMELRYTINDYFDLVGQYNYSIVQEDEIEADARRNRVFLRLDCSYPIW